MSGLFISAVITAIVAISELHTKDKKDKTTKDKDENLETQKEEKGDMDEDFIIPTYDRIYQVSKETKNDELGKLYEKYDISEFLHYLSGESKKGCVKYINELLIEIFDSDTRDEFLNAIMQLEHYLDGIYQVVEDMKKDVQEDN